MESEILPAVLSAAGLLLGVLILWGLRLRPGRGAPVWLVLPGVGSGEGLEQSLRYRAGLAGLGLPVGTAVIADLGLTPAGRALALQLTLRWPDTVLWPAEDLAAYIREHSSKEEAESWTNRI